jgi:anti-anti-sigma regulatory factor
VSECLCPPTADSRLEQACRQWPFSSTVTVESGRITVHLHGDVDATAGNWLIRPLNKALSNAARSDAARTEAVHHPGTPSSPSPPAEQELVVDATDVTFCSIDAVNLLAAAAASAAAHRVRMVLVADHPCVLRPAALADLGRWVEIRGRDDFAVEPASGTR